MARRPEYKDIEAENQEKEEIVQAVADGDWGKAIFRGVKKTAELIKSGAPHPIPFDEWLENISDEQDHEIIRYMRRLKKTKPGYAFVAGKLKIELDDDGTIICITTMYLKSVSGQWEQYELKRTDKEGSLSGWDSSPELRKLQAGEILSYDIDSPLERE